MHASRLALLLVLLQPALGAGAERPAPPSHLPPSAPRRLFPAEQTALSTAVPSTATPPLEAAADPSAKPGPTMPEEAASASVPRASIAVRTGRHPGFVRIVLEGRLAPSISAEPMGDTVRIVPGASIDDARLARMAALEPEILGANRSAGAVVLALSPGSDVRLWRLGTERLVLDVARAEAYRPRPARPAIEAGSVAPMAGAPTQASTGKAGAIGATGGVSALAGGAMEDKAAVESLHAPHRDAATEAGEAAASLLPPTPPGPEGNVRTQPATPEAAGVNGTDAWPSRDARAGQGSAHDRSAAAADAVPFLAIEQLVDPDASLIGLAGSRGVGTCGWPASRIPSDAGRRRGWQDAAHLARARCLLRRGLAAEAIAALDLSRAEREPDGTEEPAARALRAAAETLLGRSAAAEALLASFVGLEDAELRLWRALAAAGMGEPSRAWAELRRSGDVLDRYPEALRLRIGPGLVRVALASDALDAASAILAGLRTPALTASESAELDLLEAEVRLSRTPDVIPEGLLGRAIETGSWRIATEAAFALTTARERAGRITAAAALDELEAQLPFWRGHPDESTMMEHLAGLELRTDRPAEAAATLGTLLDRSAPKRGERTREPAPSQLFLDLASAGRGDPTAAIAALAVWRRHPELLSGAARDQALRDLAAGLQAAGLDDAAKSLVEEGSVLVAPAR